MLLPNCVETVLVYLACFKANFVTVPLDFRHRPEQIGYALKHSGASVFIVHADRVAELEKAGGPERDLDRAGGGRRFHG